MSSKRGYGQISSAPQGYNKATRVVGGRVLSYRPSAPVRGSSRWNAAMMNRRGVADPETGFVDLALANYALDTTGSITLLATVPQGASVNQRVGKKIAWKSIQMRGTVASNSATTFTDGAILLVYDRRPTGTLPAITDVLVSVHSASMNNDANSGRFRILRRWDFALSGNITTPATGNEVKDATAYIKLASMPGVFKAAGTGAIGDIEEGAIYLITCGSSAAGTTAAVANLGFRTRFLDV